MKPTWNAVSTEGVKIFSMSADTLGFFARSLDDLDLLADVCALAEDQAVDTIEDVGIDKCKIAFIKTVVWSRAGPSTVAAMKCACDILKESGATVTDFELPSEFDLMPSLHEQIVAGDARASFLGEYRAHKDDLDQELIDYVENGSKMSWAEHVKAKDTVSGLRKSFDSIAQGFTVILTPSAIDEADLGLEYTGSPVFNSMWTVSNNKHHAVSVNLTFEQSLHMPVINIPAFKGEHGMPIGISLVLPRYHDRRLLRAAKVVGELLVRKGGRKSGS